ncbi:tetratricopeptide repeat protein [Jejudonia soesokkakensis]|uniref:Tetratricopeptide repeat protein n=1 Tax=Jejudonia soesokkakensis TaxID=1323432 RepID=A0ABW2MUK8_9FLAO
MRNILVFLFLLVSMGTFAQSELLANNYFEKGEFEKALTIYDKLYSQNKGRLDYFLKVVEANQQLERFAEAEVLLLERTSARSVPPQLYIELGYNYALQGKDSLAQLSYKDALLFIEERPIYGHNIGSAFSKYSLLDEAAMAYERAMELDPKRDYNNQLARIYGEQGKLEKMFTKYLDLILNNPSYKSIAQRNFSLYVTEDRENEANVILRKQLLQRSQNDPDILYNELLSWLFIQQKEFKKAFTQEKAIYKRLNEDDLGGIIDVALIALDEKDYENAREMVDFVIENSVSPIGKLKGYQYLMQIELATATIADFPDIEKRFDALLAEYNYDRSTYLLQIDYNHFLAFKAGKKDQAIANLKRLAEEQLSPYQEARVKMELSDILVFDEQFNTALIYYSQIQKKVQNDRLAQEARFKVARTSYYKGDFEWSQVQLKVLRKSASQLIANDAMQLSLMIQDNSLEDSTQTALKKYARADLLALQNRDKEAIEVLDEILLSHKGESIEDEALLLQGQVYEKINEYKKAEANYLKLIEFYKDDILADDAYFKLAELYETKLDQPEKAKELYEQIVFNYAASIFFVEARKRFRTLRGDEIE